MTRHTAIVFGLMFDLPYAGIVYQFLHYLYGMRSLGWDVWYVEDSRSWPYDPMTRCDVSDPSVNVARISPILAQHGFGDRWIFRTGTSPRRCYGAGEDALRRLLREADLALNVTGCQEIREEHTYLPLLVYVQSDPFAYQVRAEEGDPWVRDQLDAHHAHFTFGELVGRPGCLVPTAGYTWLPTRQPVALELWDCGEPGSRLTTITTWHSGNKPVYWQGEPYYWTKDREFLRFAEVPTRAAVPIELAVDGDVPERSFLLASGWILADPAAMVIDVRRYYSYIVNSLGEFTAARDQYVRPRTGWFSDRSASYLAAGRPVITQDTGFAEVLPTGEGLFAFSTVEEAVEAVAQVAANPGRHGAAARLIANEYFSAEIVLRDLLARVGW